MVEQSKALKMDPISSRKSEDLIYTAPESEILQFAMTQRHIPRGNDIIHCYYCGILTVRELPLLLEVCVYT